MIPTPPTIKLAFALDCTGSMERWIHAAKTRIDHIVSDVRDIHHGNIEVALVAYRDYGDTMRFRVVDFTTPDHVVHALQDIHAEGGDDEAEDVAGALVRVCGLTWGPSDIRMVFHIADAPAHGLNFHRPRVSDRFPNGDPDGFHPLDSITHLARQDVEFTFVRITSSTDVMTDIFHETYMLNSGVFHLLDLYPQSYDGRYGPQCENMAELLSPAITKIVSDKVTQYTSSQDR
jgi:hypothetical protein